MNGKVKSNSVVSVTLLKSDGTPATDMNAPLMRFAVVGAGTVDLDIRCLPADLQRRAIVHGMKARIVDAAAMSCGADGKSASPQVKFEAIRALVEHYNTGTSEWSPKRSERIGNDESLLSIALQELRSDRTAEQIRAYVTGLTKPQRAALMLDAKVKPVIERLRGEATAGIDTEALLSAL